MANALLIAVVTFPKIWIIAQFRRRVWRENDSFRAINKVIGAIIVVMAVTVTDSARLDFAMNAITFEASPLEHEPMRMTPAAISGGNAKIFVSASPTSGMTVKWQKIPTNTPRGDFATPAKSFTLICVPMPNMTS